MTAPARDFEREGRARKVLALSDAILRALIKTIQGRQVQDVGAVAYPSLCEYCRLESGIYSLPRTALKPTALTGRRPALATERSDDYLSGREEDAYFNRESR